MVALTGFEWVSGRFTSVRFSLSCSFSIHLVPIEAQLFLCESPWCDHAVTPRAAIALRASLGAAVLPHHLPTRSATGRRRASIGSFMHRTNDLSRTHR